MQSGVEMSHICKTALLSCAVAIIFGATACSKPDHQSEIRIGGIFDLTGATHEISVPYADGIRKYVEYINEKGGVNGRRIKLIEKDSAYLTPRAKMAYETLVEQEKVCAILGWGTGDTEYLRPFTAKDKIPFMSGSYSSRLGDIKEAPYNFLIGVTYSDQMRIIINFIRGEWKEKTRKPRIAFIYNDTDFGRSPIIDGRAYALKKGMEIVAEEIVSLDARDAKEQLKKIAESKADYAIIQETTWAASVILKNAAELKMKTRFIGLNWCADEKLIALAGSAAEGFIGTMPFIFTHGDNKTVRQIVDYSRSKGSNIEGYLSRYISGWVTAMVMMEGIRLAGDDISGEGIRKGLERIKEFNTGEITAPVTFSPSDHKGCRKLKIGRVHNGQWQIISGYLSAD